MDYTIQGLSVTLIAIFLPVIMMLLYKFLFGRTRSSSSRTNDNVISDSQPSPSVEYDVFLSFRGPDTRQMADILYRMLLGSKIHAFKDAEPKGEGLPPHVARAIDRSRVYIPILSKNYAQSNWCMRELVEMVNRQKWDKRLVILPIFYMVDPRDVRHQIGPYQNAFQQHHRDFDEATVQGWKNALAEVGAMKGWQVNRLDEQAAIADQVLEVIWSHLNKNNNDAIEADELAGGAQ